MNGVQMFLNNYRQVGLFFVRIISSKKIIFLSPIFLWLLNQLFFWQPKMFFIALAIGFFLIATTVIGLTLGKRQVEWPSFFYFPFIFFLSSSLYTTLLPNYFVIQLIFLLTSLLLFWYFKNLYYLFKYEAPERAHKLDSLTLSGSFLVVFFLAAAVYGLPTFLGWSFWPLFSALFILTLPLFFQPFIILRINLKHNWPLFLASALVLLELATIINFLPLAFNVLGLFIAIFFYLLLFILRNILAGDFSGHKLRLPLVFSLSIIMILLLTLRWF